MSARDLFTTVCGKQLDACVENECNSVDLLDKIENFDRNEELLNYGESRDCDPFEDMLEKSARERDTKEEKSLYEK